MSSSIVGAPAPRPARAALAALALATLVLATLEHAACLPLDDLSSYSSAWERPPALVVDDDALDASTGAGERGDSGATPGGAGAALDAGGPLAPPPDASPSAPASDAGEPAVIRDAGSALDAGSADAAP